MAGSGGPVREVTRLDGGRPCAWWWTPTCSPSPAPYASKAPHLACSVPISQLACDCNAEPEPFTGGIRFTIGVMVDTAEEVDRLTGQMRQAGARITKAPVDAEFFAGRSAYLCDPEGNYFEIAWVEPGWPRWPTRAGTAVTAGSRSFAAIGQWAADAGAGVLAGLGAVRGPAEESTFRRAFALISADVPGQVIGAWFHTRATQAGGRLVIAVDGKAVRGARNREEKAPHLVAALAHGIGAVLGQVAAAAKSNEIPAVRELLKAFTDLAGAVITAGALHTQSDTAQAITGRHADYVMTVKTNMPALCKQLKKLPWTAIPATSAVSTGHGRRARRTIKAVLVPAWIEFAGAAQVAQVRRTVTKKGKKTVEGTAGRGQRRRCSQPTRARQVQDRCAGSGKNLPFACSTKPQLGAPGKINTRTTQTKRYCGTGGTLRM